MTHILCAINVDNTKRIISHSFFRLIGQKFNQSPQYTFYPHMAQTSSDELILSCGAFDASMSPRFVVSNKVMAMIGESGEKSKFPTFTQEKLTKKLRSQAKSHAGMDTMMTTFYETDTFLFALNADAMSREEKASFIPDLIEMVDSANPISDDTIEFTELSGNIVPLGIIYDGRFAVAEFGDNGVYTTVLESHNINKMKIHESPDSPESAKEALAQLINR